MKRLLLSTLLIILIISLSEAKGKVYLFTYFKGNGEDGLHLAYSRDGFNFTALMGTNPSLNLLSVSQS